MKIHLLKISGLAVGMLTMQLCGFVQAQAQEPAPLSKMDRDTAGAPHTYQEIIIRQKNDKDDKVTVEIKNGEMLINGKPASEYEDGNLVIMKRKLKKNVYMDGGDMAISPFRDGGGAWLFKDYAPAGNKAFLGVTSIRSEDGPAGAKIGEVSQGSAAEKAGLKEGDLITKVDEMPVEGPEDLSRAIGKYQPGDKATITYKRDGKEQKVTATLGRGKSMKMDMFRYNGPDGGDFDLRDFKRMMPPGYNFSNGPQSGRLGIRAQDTEDGRGAKVLFVDGESVAAKAGIKEGDIITNFDGQSVKDATSLAAAARESRVKPTVKVSVLRDGKTLELEVKNPRKLKTADL